MASPSRRCHSPPESGLAGKLVRWNPASPADVSGRIAYVYVAREPGAVSPGAAYRQAFQACAEAGAIGVVAAMSGPSGEVVAINTPVTMTLTIPVLQLGEKLKSQLDGIVDVGSDVTLTITGRAAPQGEEHHRPLWRRGPLGDHSTPQSGWFTCGGERGPGIAMSRALAVWAIKQDLPVRWLFVATSGHEWTDHGADLFHQNNAPGAGRDSAMVAPGSQLRCTCA
jgi:hypothetical protein